MKMGRINITAMMVQKTEGGTDDDDVSVNGRRSVPLPFQSDDEGGTVGRQNSLASGLWVTPHSQT